MVSMELSELEYELIKELRTLPDIEQFFAYRHVLRLVVESRINQNGGTLDLGEKYKLTIIDRYRDGMQE